MISRLLTKICYSHDIHIKKEKIFKNTSLSLTTTIVNLINPNKSLKTLILFSSLQDNSQCTGESLDLSNLISRANSRAGK